MIFFQFLFCFTIIPYSAFSGFTLAGCQVPSKLLLPLQQDMLREKDNGQLMGQGEDRERSLTNFCHRQKRLEIKQFLASQIKAG